MQRHYGIDHGKDEHIGCWVLNWTRPYFSVGFTTSPSVTGHLLGVLVADNAVKRQDQTDGSHFKVFQGVLIQACFWWFKLYLYLYWRGDGLQ